MKHILDTYRYLSKEIPIDKSFLPLEPIVIAIPYVVSSIGMSNLPRQPITIRNFAENDAEY